MCVCVFIYTCVFAYLHMQLLNVCVIYVLYVYVYTCVCYVHIFMVCMYVCLLHVYVSIHVWCVHAHACRFSHVALYLTPGTDNLFSLVEDQIENCGWFLRHRGSIFRKNLVLGKRTLFS